MFTFKNKACVRLGMKTNHVDTEGRKIFLVSSKKSFQRLLGTCKITSRVHLLGVICTLSQQNSYPVKLWQNVAQYHQITAWNADFNFYKIFAQNPRKLVQNGAQFAVMFLCL